MPNTALVTGATGLLGREVVRQFEHAGWNVIGTGFSRATRNITKLDLTNRSEIDTVLDGSAPQAVVHCAANRAPDIVDKDPDAARSLNISATQLLVRATSSRGIFLLYISTDYVFAGKPGEAPYSAHAPTGPTNLYGQTKLDGENIVLEQTEDNGLAAVLRIPVLYGPTSETRGNAESAVNVLMDTLWKAQKESVKVDDWSMRYPTLTTDVGRVCRDICQRFVGLSKGEDRCKTERVLQFSAEERFTKYEICQAFAEIMGLPLDRMVPNKEGNDPTSSVQRPYDCHLSTQTLKELGIDVSAQDFRGWWRWYCKAYRK